MFGFLLLVVNYASFYLSNTLTHEDKSCSKNSAPSPTYLCGSYNIIQCSLQHWTTLPCDFSVQHSPTYNIRLFSSTVPWLNLYILSDLLKHWLFLNCFFIRYKGQWLQKLTPVFQDTAPCNILLQHTAFQAVLKWFAISFSVQSVPPKMQKWYVSMIHWSFHWSIIWRRTNLSKCGAKRLEWGELLSL